MKRNQFSNGTESPDNYVFYFYSDVAEREPLEVNDAIYIETTNHCDDASYLNGDYFCPASPTTVPVFKSRSNSGRSNTPTLSMASERWFVLQI